MSTPIHDWLRPRLEALLAEAVQQGMDHQAVVAVMTDIIVGANFNQAGLPEDPILNPVSDIEHEPLTERDLPIRTHAPWEGGLLAK